jgi:hypothetical protein
LLANQLEGVASHPADARFNTHVEFIPLGLEQSAMIARLKNAQLKTIKSRPVRRSRLKIPVPVASCNA